MALVKETIEIQIDALLTATADMKLKDAKKEFREQLAQIIIDAIKSATITVQPGIIQVQGTAVAQANTIPIVIINSIT